GPGGGVADRIGIEMAAQDGARSGQSAVEFGKKIDHRRGALMQRNLDVAQAFEKLRRQCCGGAGIAWRGLAVETHESLGEGGEIAHGTVGSHVWGLFARQIRVRISWVTVAARKAVMPLISCAGLTVLTSAPTIF